MEKASLTIVVYFSAMELLRHVQRYYTLRHHRATVSTVDNRTYYVLSGVQAANLLAQTRLSLKRLIQSFSLTESIDPDIRLYIRRITAIFPNGEGLQLYEIDHTRDPNLAYTLNKTDGFFFCLKTKDQWSQAETLLFLAIHELTHAGLAAFEQFENGFSVHSPQFKKVEKFVYEKAAQLQMLDYRTIPGRSHCDGILLDPTVAQ